MQSASIQTGRDTGYPGVESRECTYMGVLIGSLLPLLAHGPRGGLGKEVDGIEEGDGGENELAGLESDSHALALGRLGTGPMRSEGNPVSYVIDKRQQILIDGLILCSDSQVKGGGGKCSEGHPYRPFSPAWSSGASQPSSGLSAASTTPPAPGEACPPSASRCRPGWDSRWHAQKTRGSVGQP